MTTTQSVKTNDAPPAEVVEAVARPIAVAYKTYFLDLPMVMTREALRFTAHRLEEQAKLLTNLSACTTLADMAETQSIFLNDAIGDYRQEASVFAHRANQVVVAPGAEPLSL